jgi:hypothetical protein
MTETALLPILDRWIARWLAGGAPPEVGAIPAAWRDVIGEDDELAMLCVATQWRQFMLDTPLPHDAVAGAAMPAPPLMLLPDALRVRFRRFARSISPELLVGLLRALAACGHMAHPFDWLPGAEHEGLPDAYDGFARWALSQRQPSTMARADSEDWAQLPAAERRRAFARLREADPAAARAALAAALAGFGAEHRLALVETLGIELSLDDLPMLTGLAADRSEKVQLAAARLRARLGDFAPVDASGRSELHDWFTIGKAGLLSRRTTVSLKPLKTQVQRSARRERLAAIGWSGLAEVLELDPQALAEAWTPADPDDSALLDSLANSAPQPVVDATLQRLVVGELSFGANVSTGGAIAVMLQRCGSAGRCAIVREALTRRSMFTRFGELQPLLEQPLVHLDLRALRDSPPWEPFQTLLQQHLRDGSAFGFAQETAALSAIVAQPVAADLLRYLTGEGLRLADPILDPLVLIADCPAPPPLQGSRP